METLPSPADSVPADTSLFFQLELAAFVSACKRNRPEAWAKVQALQAACLAHQPVTDEGRSRADRVLQAA